MACLDEPPLSFKLATVFWMFEYAVSPIHILVTQLFHQQLNITVASFFLRRSHDMLQSFIFDAVDMASMTLLSDKTFR